MAGIRPTEFTPEIGDALCEKLSQGISLNRICKADDMPARSTVYKWLRTQKDFVDNYVRAKDDSADALSDDIEDIADEVRRGKLDPNAGRVAGDLKKWVASKLKPKKYGDKLDHTTDGQAITFSVVRGSDAPPNS